MVGVQVSSPPYARRTNPRRVSSRLVFIRLLKSNSDGHGIHTFHQNSISRVLHMLPPGIRGRRLRSRWGDPHHASCVRFRFVGPGYGQLGAPNQRSREVGLSLKRIIAQLNRYFYSLNYLICKCILNKNPILDIYKKISHLPFYFYFLT